MDNRKNKLGKSENAHLQAAKETGNLKNDKATPTADYKKRADANRTNQK